MSVGQLIVLTDRAQARGDVVDVVRAAVFGGATGVLLREKDLPRAGRAALALAIRRLVEGTSGARLLIASDVELTLEVGADGVHLAADDPWPGEALHGVRGHREGAAGAVEAVAGSDNRPEGRLLVGRSCHTEAELLAARDEGVDYATVSPVFPTASKPGYGPGLGIEGLAELCRKVPDLPVIALGGIGPGRVTPCLAAGAAGVAMMGEVMRAEDPAALVSGLRHQTSEPEAL